MKKILPLFLLAILALACNQAKTKNKSDALVPQDSSSSNNYKELALWTTSIPDSTVITGTESYNDGMIKNVSHPTIKIFSPKANNTGVAIIVFPGGGYNKLAIDLEGSQVCEWLASIGITGVLLKYRVPASGPHHDDACDCQKDPVKPLALEDAQRAMAMIRYHHQQWSIDPNKIGVMGFSAGGHLVADVSTNYKKLAYSETDEIDKVSCKPNFGIAFYPGHMTFHADKPYSLNKDLPVDSNTSPMFILQAGNDNVDSIQNSLVYYIALKKAGVSAEYHIYAEGGHAFGLNESAQKVKNWASLPIADWELLVERWLKTIHMTSN
jgi:acetyl esterase/lipase